MPTPFDPQKRFAEIQAGKWPQYEKFFQKHLAKEGQSGIQLAKGLHAFRTFRVRDPASPCFDPPDQHALRLQAEAFLTSLLENVRGNKKGYLRALVRADAKIKIGKLDRHFTIRDLIFLAAIHLRAEKPKCHLNPVDLRELVTPYHQRRGKPAPIHDTFWNRILAMPDIQELLRDPPG